MSSQHLTVSPHVLAQELEDETMILDLNSEQYYRFEGPTSDMWRLLSQHGSLSKAVETLQTYYGVDRAVLQRDVENFARELEQLGLIQTTPTNAA